ncbi:transmembrane protein 248-like [Oratosquilla oratoria]|uniref:transmembrane protein 248-like n=1 Tax=Oratosquilla oratoria TaxID=337810 RepID=UPI003F7710D1
MVACAGLRDFLVNRPPMVVFMLSVSAFALAFVGVSIYIEIHKKEIRNPDIKMDWNMFFEKLSKLEMCPLKETKTRSRRTTTSTVHDEDIDMPVDKNVTFAVTAVVSLRPMKNGHDAPIHGFITAKNLGFERDTSMLEVNIKMAPKKKDRLKSCLFLFGPEHLLPKSPIQPETCHIEKPENNIEMKIILPEEREWCTKGEKFKLHIDTQPELNVFLTEDDIAMIHIHILYTTSFLFISVIAILFTSIYRKRVAARVKGQNPDQIPLQP